MSQADKAANYPAPEEMDRKTDSPIYTEQRGCKEAWLVRQTDDHTSSDTEIIPNPGESKTLQGLNRMKQERK